MHGTIASVPDLILRAVECSPLGVLIADATHPDHPIVYANPAFSRITGYAIEDVIGKNCRFLQSDDRDQPALATVRDALARREEVSVVLRNYRKDGVLFWNQLSISPVLDPTGNVTHFICLLADVTIKQQYLEQLPLRSACACDSLTGLPSRQLTRRNLEEAIQVTDRDSELAALIILDVDNFRLVNSAVDDDGAELLLKAVGERLSSNVQKQAYVSRHGVDEFAVVVGALNDANEVSKLADSLSRAMMNPFVIKDGTVRITCSIGIALYPQDGTDPITLLRHAGMALRHAKEQGRNNTQFFSSKMSDRVLEHVQLGAALRSAIESNALHLYYQPLVDLQTGLVSGLEALARWRHPEFGEIPPIRFVTIADECGLTEQLGEWTLQCVCRDMHSWAEHGLAGMRVAVNISPRQFCDPLLAAKVEKTLSEAGISPSLISFEITENVLIQDAEASESALARLKALGIGLVLDDFGTGFSSLGYLKRFPFEKVKIDQSFVGNIATDPEDGAVSKAVISMAHSLGIRVVAEGVETEAQCEFLQRNMCDEIQGFLYSPALPADELETFLKEQRQLPQHLLRISRPPRTLLLVDDEVNIVAALKRLLRRDNYTILTANSGQEGLEVLAKQEVDVIVSDQRMPGMTGVEFLRKAKEIFPNTVRIVLSGYTELQSVTDAINEGAIYKFLMKPWDDTQLRAHIEEAFRNKEMADENLRLNLEVRTANFELAAANRRLEQVLRQQQQQIRRGEVSLDVVREVLQHVPVPVIGLDEEEYIAFINTSAQLRFQKNILMLGSDARETIPDIMQALSLSAEQDQCDMQLSGTTYRVTARRMGYGSESRGRLITLTPQEERHGP